MDEVLGIRKRHGRGTELRDLEIRELSAVDDPANGIADWLMLKSVENEELAEALVEALDSDDDDDGFRVLKNLDALSSEEIEQLAEWFTSDREGFMKALEPMVADGYSEAIQRVVRGHTTRADLS